MVLDFHLDSSFSTMPPFQPLNVIPVELLVQILSSLDYLAVLRCRQVCKSFEALIGSTSSLQLIVELHAAGQDMEPNGTASSVIRLELLKQRTAAWDELKYTKDHRIPMSSGNLWELYGGVLAQSTAEKTIIFRRLPSLCRSIEEVEWTLDAFGFPVRDFGMDPSQDLLVIVEAPRWSDTDHTCRIHLRSLSTGHHHPRAQTPMIICYSQKVLDALISLTIQISGDHLGVLFNHSGGPENEVYIWDWKKGTTEANLSGDEMESFVFMSKREVIFGLLGPSENEDLAVTLLVLDFEKECNERHAITEVEHGVSFLYPSFQPHIGLVTFEIRSDPAPTLTPPSRLQLPFFTASHNRLLTASLSIIHNNRLQTVMLFSPLATFRSCLDRRITGQKTIDWSVWGPKTLLNMIPHASSPRTLVTASLRAKRTQTFKAFYATIRGLRQPSSEPDGTPISENDFFLSILRANPSLRDTRSYLASFGPQPQTSLVPVSLNVSVPSPSTAQLPQQTMPALEHPKPSPILASILNPVIRRTALVKVQGPFTDVQLESITRGLVYLEKLGLVSVIVVENDELPRGEQDERAAIIEETMRVVTSLEKHGSRARPVVGAIVRLGPKPGDDEGTLNDGIAPPESHTVSSDLIPIRSALRAGEIPVISPFALDSFCRSIRIDANDVIAGLARGMVEAAVEDQSKRGDQRDDASEDVDLTPLRLMIINREGGVPSYARSGYPHLLINLASEYSHIHQTFHQSWLHSNPTALANLSLARTCLTYMPSTSSAIMVSHRSSSSLIANLITNKPAVSSSLPHALLQGNRKLTPNTPTLLRRGLPVQVIRNASQIDRTKMNTLLEQSFNKTLDQGSFYERLEKTLDYVILAGDYAGAAIVTKEECPGLDIPISYLDKFAVLPSHQGDGTVDFLWVALHDESYGLGLPFSANPNGGKGGKGQGQDLVWRSRTDNPVNKWYFERSSGHLRMGSWVLFWCDAERRLEIEKGRRGRSGLSYIEDWEDGRLEKWADVIFKIPGSWRK
ncbi:hypothetical protein D9615_001390 [Tricholomella constricta]|uniref:Amino-acid acetyltransferase, mitochondrial n=1 Tax=Tricholomella constricta TaxID=117010 RepID=A0A8H5HKL3_9AGAR|nr:hypothetical protein D9615_001390 [Tricholomella constricta]